MARQQRKCLRRADAWTGSSGNACGEQAHGRAAVEMSAESRRMAGRQRKCLRRVDAWLDSMRRMNDDNAGRLLT